MKTVLHFVLVFGAFVAYCHAQGCGPAKSCGTGWAYKKHFDELGCPQINSTLDANCCATSFDCSKLSTRSASQCTYKGITYPLLAKLPADVQAQTPCVTDCVCMGVPPAWSCVKKTCPAVTLPPNCTALYRPGECCSYDMVCTRAPPMEYTCKIGPVFFRENSLIPTADPCMSCICMRGFMGQMVTPFCNKTNCGIELTDYDLYMKKGCAPVYVNSNPPPCCPAKWICPSEMDVIVVAKVNPNMFPLNPAIKCTFGTKTLTDGESIVSYTADGGCTQCVCHTTPGLTCSAIAKCPPPPAGTVTLPIL